MGIESGSETVQAIESTPLSIIDNSAITLNIKAKAYSNQIHFYCKLEQSFNIQTSEWRLHKIQAEMLSDSRQDGRITEVGKWLETFHAHTEVNSCVANVTCPECWGVGSFITFAIPKADYESGLSGYNLYSCNIINGTKACTRCGGSGQEFKQWYINENPELGTVASKESIYTHST